MSMLNDIKSALRRAAIDGLEHSYEIGPQAPEKIQSDIVERIAASILSRQITIRPETGAAVTLLAEGGRLHHIQTADRSVDTRVRRAEDAVHTLDAVTQTNGRVTLHTHPTDLPKDTNSRGVAARDLAQALGLRAPEGDENLDPRDELIQSLPKETQVSIALTDDGFDLLSGAQADGAALVAWAGPLVDALLADTSPLASALETQGSLTLGWGADRNRHILIRGRLGHLVLASVQGPAKCRVNAA